jgi:hypothetical protein
VDAVYPMAMDKYLDLNYVTQQGMKNLLWIAIIVVIAVGLKTGKIYFNSIGSGERGLRDFFGIVLWPVLFGPGLSIKGVTTVRRTTLTPQRATLRASVMIGEEKITYLITVLYRVRGDRKHLRAALYGVKDEDKGDLDNPERTEQTQSILVGAARDILKEADGMDAVTKGALIDKCGDELLDRFGEEIDRVVIEDDTPADATILARALKGNDLNTALAAAVAAGHPRLEVVPSEVSTG